MIQVNLIRGKRKKRREFSIGSLIFIFPVLVLVGVVYFHITVSDTINRLQSRLKWADEEIARQKKDIEEMERFDARKAELQKKVDIISTLQRDRVGPVRYFEALSSAIPEKCWIDKLEIKGQQLTVSGVALNNNTVANFMTALLQTGRFRDIQLGSADLTSSRTMTTKLVRFNLTFMAAD